MKTVMVWFDGSCPLCSREIATMRRLDRHRAVTFVDIGATDNACPVDRRVALERLHAREDAGPLLSGAAAFGAMWRAIPLLRPLGLLAQNGVVLRALEWAYLHFLRFRPTSQALIEARAIKRSEAPGE